MAQPRPKHDPTIYPVDDGMGENTFETYVREIVRPLLARFLASKGTPMLVGSNQFIYWEQFNSSASVAPDLYVIPGLPADAEPACLKLFELDRSCVPSFALEIVSSDWQKDYLVAPRRYDAMGVKELVIYDPGAGSHRERVRFQVQRRTKSRGLAPAVVTDEDRVHSKALGCYLREVPVGSSVRLRLGVGKHGDELFPTEAEAREALGKAEGLREGLREGEAKGLREAIAAVCELLGVELTPSRQAKVEALEIEGLEALLSSLKKGRKWPR